MSLILEALKKLERERDTTGRGFLVVAHTPWRATRGRAARVALVAVAAGALAGTAAWGVWTVLSSRDTARATAGGDSPAVPRGPASPLPPPIWETTALAPPPSSDAPAAARPRAAATAGLAAGPAVAPSAAADEPPLLVIAPRAAPAAATLHLEAISSQDGQPVAVINGRLVRKGETIEGAVVTWIGADAVEIEVDGRRRVLGF